MKKLIKLVSLSAVFFTSVTLASHNDSEIVGLLVTVTGNTNGQVTIDVSGQGRGSSSLPSAQLGSQFFYDLYTGSSPNNWVIPVPAAVDWGDGNVITNAGIPFTGTAGPNPTFSGQFLHTYTVPGNYTIRTFGTNVYATGFNFIPLSGNAFSATSPSYYRPVSTTYNSIGTFVRFSGLGAIGVTATATVSAAAVAAPAIIPTSSTLSLLIMGLFLALAGFVVIRRA